MEYKSRYPELGFYVGEQIHYFRAGRYVTDDTEAIAVLDSITDAERVETEMEPKALTEVKPARKANANASAKYRGWRSWRRM
ncbi:hypothetical protein [Cohnella silvisoli]|uniref:Uncharacterized protein n=1 Tax=Cohnella silvisoli TaxID=2873699 RepID=A0ABV1KYV6_9BACL|nr:hypothetical protein [Cohnella silvisoli]MCD9024320.1 hypothetical protein [Cohnella silvisoli]